MRKTLAVTLLILSTLCFGVGAASSAEAASPTTCYSPQYQHPLPRRGCFDIHIDIQPTGIVVADLKQAFGIPDRATVRIKSAEGRYSLRWTWAQRRLP